eukprot:8859246-Pyramimonas_sp.AAC.1
MLASRAPLGGVLGALLGAFWEPLGPSWDYLGRLEKFLGRLGGLQCRLGGLLCAFVPSKTRMLCILRGCMISGARVTLNLQRIVASGARALHL